MLYVIIWHVSSKSLYIYRYEDTGMTEMASATESIYLGDPGVDRHHLIIRNTHAFFPCSWSHPCWAFIDPHNLCGSSWPGIPSYPLTLFLHSSSQNRSFSWILFGCYARCSGVLMMGCLPSSSTILPQRDWVNLEMHSEAIIVQTWTP